MKGAGSFAPLTPASTPEPKRMYLGLRAASQKLEVIGDGIQRTLSQLPDCLAFHHIG